MGPFLDQTIARKDGLKCPGFARELMRQHITGSQLRVISQASHYSPWEQPNQVARALRQFLDRIT